MNEIQDLIERQQDLGDAVEPVQQSNSAGFGLRVLRSSWCVCGTESGRWSSGKNSMGGGLNAQTIPKAIRWCIVPPPGHVFIQPDLANAEGRVVGYLCGSPAMIDIFNDPSKSLHMENAKAIFGEYPKKDSANYQLGKKTTHAANYKISAGFFSTIASVPRGEATRLLDAYHAAYPEVRLWHDWVRDEIATKGVLRTSFGRERIFATARAELLITGKISNDAWKDAISYVPQATVPDVTNHGMVGLWESAVGPELRFHHQGHDSFLCSCPVELLGEAATELIKQLTIPLQITDIHGVERTLTIPCDVAYGFNWFAMKGWKGEQVADRIEWEKWVKNADLWESVKESLLA